MNSNIILSVREISKYFFKRLDLAGKIAQRLGAPVAEETIYAVDGVSFDVREGEVFGLVGESGCGKSTLGRVVSGIHLPTEGEVYYRGKSLQDLGRKDCLGVQMIFQDSMSSLNPRMRVRSIIAEGPQINGVRSAAKLQTIVEEKMSCVGLDPAFMRRYPHQFSGGQRQRIGIARALAVDPDLLVCDESIAALDVSIQAQVLNLLMDLRKRFALTYIFISHDLAVVEHISDRVGIMYLGRIVELAPTQPLFAAPKHPYTQALLSGIPKLVARKRDHQPVKGEIPSPLDPPPGCHFHPRCPHAMDRCRTEIPVIREISPGHLAACHLNDTAVGTA
jgi:peptide/nickel transport system ATP-binding protein